MGWFDGFQRTHGGAAQITLKQTISVTEYPWCKAAVLFSVKHGRGALYMLRSPNARQDPDYRIPVRLMLKDKPLLQKNMPSCPTCASLLATGYGIERMDCPVLDAVRQQINADYVNLETALERLTPLLGLLQDGLYLLADVPHFPTDGDGHFFYDVPNTPTELSATCSAYYNGTFLSAIDGFPAYLYPTQSDACISEERVQYYVNFLQNSADPPRAIAYYTGGFMSALLDGHHKAVAAARCGKAVPCLTIIPADGWGQDMQTGKKALCFSAIQVAWKRPESCIQPYQTAPEAFAFEPFHLLRHTVSGGTHCADAYPTIRIYSSLSLMDMAYDDIDEAQTEVWLMRQNEEDLLYLEIMLYVWKSREPERAFALARRILACDGSLPKCAACRCLLADKSPQTEQVFIDYLVRHTTADPCSAIIASYWDDQT